METLAFPLLVTKQRNNTGVVSVSMGIFDYGCLVTTAFSQTRYNIRLNTIQNLVVALKGRPDAKTIWPTGR
jgi:hypothetical protein